ncbi:MAG: HAMP domain-containing sensor histidine kinase [Trueperaceae bacterium]|nr:HAMP domain-containing sensor histidine kinase [Trueperaceae bacterium]
MRRRLGRFDLRAKLALVAFGVTLLGIVVGLALMYVALLNARLAAIDNEGRLLANVILGGATLREDEAVRVPQVVESYLTDLGGVSVAHVYVDGTLVWEGGVVDAPRPLDPGHLLVGGGSRSVEEWRVFTARDEDAGVVVQVGQPLQAVRSVLRPYASISVGVTLLVAVLSGWLAWSSVGVALRPLRRLSEAVEGFGSTTTVPALPGRDEPARLARTFTSLLERLRREREREQTFLAYAAHELRTPVTALRSGLEALHAGRLDPDREMFGRLFREAVRLETLAQNLLVLSRAAARDTREAPLDLEELASEAYDRFQPLASERGLSLNLDTAAVTLRGDVRLLTQALDNLIDNAFRAAGRGRVTLRSGVLDGEPFLEVADSGPGPPDPVRDGLGLRVVRNVARAHDARFELTNDGGARARITFPAPDAQGTSA